MLLQAAHETTIANLDGVVELLAERASNYYRSIIHSEGTTNRKLSPSYNNRALCLKLLLASGAHHMKMTIRMLAILEEEESAKLLHAAGFAGFEDRVLMFKVGKVVPQLCLDLTKKYYAKRIPVRNPDGNILLLQELCRDAIRSELLRHNAINLFKVVPRLSLPEKIESFLLHDMSLDT